MNKKIFIYVLITALQFQMAAPALAGMGDPLPLDPKPVVKPTPVATTEAKPKDLPKPTCPETKDSKELNEILNKKDLEYKNFLTKLNTEYKKLAIPTSLQEDTLRGFSQTLRQYCVNKLDTYSRQLKVPSLNMGIHNKNCGALRGYMDSNKVFIGTITASQKSLTDAKTALAKNFSERRALDKKNIETRLAICQLKAADPACPSAPKLKNQFLGIWGPESGQDKQNNANAFFTFFWKSLDQENNNLQATKDTLQKKLAVVDKSCGNLGSLGDPTAPVQDEKVAPLVAAATPGEDIGTDTSVPDPAPLVEEPQDTGADTSSEAVPLVDPLATAAVPQVDPLADPSPPELPPPGTGKGTGDDTGTGGSSWLSSPWLWGGVGALGAGGLTYWWMNSKVEKEKMKTYEAKIALREEQLKNLNTTGTGTGSTTGTSDGVDTGTGFGTDTGSDTGSTTCSLAMGSMSSNAMMNSLIPSVQISLINGNGTLSNRDNTSVVNVTCANCSMSGPTSATAVNGVATFSGLSFTRADRGVILTFSSGTCSSISSGSIDVSEPGARNL